MADSEQERPQEWIERLKSGDAGDRDALIAHVSDRLRRLTHKMLQDFPRLRRWLDADDVFQNAVLRLMQALRSVAPTSPPELFRLATRQLRRELLDLTRHYFGPEGLGANHDSLPPKASDSSGGAPPAYEKSESTYDPQRLAAWGEFHQRVESLPAEEGEVFDLLWYQGLTQAEAAALLGVSVPTIKRRWLTARLKMQEKLSPLGPIF